MSKDIRTCLYCEGELNWLGCLGHLTYFRCRRCGLQEHAKMGAVR